MVYQCHVSPCALFVGYCLVAGDLLLAHLHLQVVVGSDTQLDGIVVVALAEEHCILCLVGQYPHLYGEILLVPVTCKLGGETVVHSVEIYRYGMVGLRTVAYASYLEVVVGEVTLGDGLIEVEAYLIVDGEHPVGRLCATEETWVVHILHAGVYLRYLLVFYIVDHAGTYGTQVIVLVLQVVEHPLVLDGTCIGREYHLGILSVGDSLVIQSLVVVVAHQCGPVVVRCRCRLILQHDTMEVVVVHVESVEHHLHVMLLHALLLYGRQLGVVGPVVRRLRDIHIRSRWYVVYREHHIVHDVVEEVGGIRLALRLQLESQVVIVHYCTLVYFECLYQSLSGRHEKCTSVAYGRTVHNELCTIGVRCIVHHEVVPAVLLSL